MPPSPVLCAKSPRRAAQLSARTALLEIAPKLNAETLSSDAEYGCWQSGPPTLTRKSASRMVFGTEECVSHS